MTPEAIRNFKVLGSCVGTPTTSLDMVIDLSYGVLYKLNFDQDFSSIQANGQPITEMSTSSIIEAIEFLYSMESESEIHSVNTYTPSREGYLRGKELFESVDKVIKKERKQEKKYEKKHKKRKREKRAQKYLKWLSKL